MLVVQKFGGTSLKDEESREKVIKKICAEKNNGNNVVVVVSAMGRKPMPYSTDALISLVKQGDEEIEKRDLDLLMSCGEIISSLVIASLLNKKGIKAKALTGWQAGIITNSEFGNAKIKCIKTSKIKELINEDIIPVITGFQGITEDLEITTLGRGGSDTTASALGEAIEADVIEIYTDVNGIMTADPRVCKEAKTIKEMPYDQLFQMADSGANVIHKDAAYVAQRANIKMKIKNTFTNEDGTTISNKVKVDYDKIFTGIANLDNRVKVEIVGNQINTFDLLAKNKISLDMINIFTDTSIFTIAKKDLKKTEKIFNNEKIEYSIEDDCSKVTVIGKITGIPGVMNRIVQCLTKENIKILQTVDSLVSISVLVKTNDVKKAVEVLHKDLGLENKN